MAQNKFFESRRFYDWRARTRLVVAPIPMWVSSLLAQVLQSEAVCVPRTSVFNYMGPQGIFNGLTASENK